MSIISIPFYSSRAKLAAKVYNRTGIEKKRKELHKEIVDDCRSINSMLEELNIEKVKERLLLHQDRFRNNQL